MGNSPNRTNASVRLIASENSWIEGDALQQLNHVAGLPGMDTVVGLPDLHPGRGYPVGMSCLSRGRFYPALVGNDIGCGMSLFTTDVPTRKIKLDKWEKRLRQSAFTEQGSWEREASIQLQLNTHNIGTIGGGNHFAEFQKVIHVHDELAMEQLGLDKRMALLLVHSGSRGLGQQILREHVECFGHAGLIQGTPEAEDYLAQHNQALEWAFLNRELIGTRLAAALSLELERKLDVHHNFVAPAPEFGTDAWIHRKGSAPADAGFVVIPGSRGDSSYLVRPRPDAKSLYSLAHGAGRKWQRGECMARLKGRYKAADLVRTSMGSRVICDDRNLLFEEAPEAYKKVDSVIADLLEARLIDLVAELAPVLTYKNQQAKPGPGGACE